MRKILITALIGGLLAGGLSVPATAGKKAKPVKHTLYLHGRDAVGETEIPDTAGTATFKKLDEEKPTAAEPKSQFVTNYIGGPNTQCSGNNLFPTWGAFLSGTVKGDVKLYLNALSHPANEIQVDLFADAAGGCESSLGSTGFVPPVASAVVSLAPGLAENEIVFENVKFKAVGNLAIMVTPANLGSNPSQARLFYDSADFASRVEFSCIAPKGKKTCLS